MPSLGRRGLTVIAVTLSLVGSTLGITHAANAADNRKTLGGTKPAWAKSAADKGAASSGQQIDAKIWLAGKNPAGLDAYATAVSTPGSASYGKFLTPAQYQARFGATTAQVNAVTTWAKSAGLSVVSANSHYIQVKGTLSHAGSALKVGFHNFSVGGKTYRAPNKDATVPASLGTSVLTITGLDNKPTIHQHNDALPPPDPNYWVAQPCSSYYGQKYATDKPKAYGKTQPYVTCGLTPQQIRGAYGVTGSGLTGKGVTVAITDAYALSTMESDADTYAKEHGDKPFRKGQYTEVLPSGYDLVDECGASGWYGEEALDVESVHNVAPDANVVYVAGSNCADGLTDALVKIVDGRLADIVTNSWGSLSQDYDASGIAAMESIFKQGAIEGIGFNFSSGDCGYESATSGCGSGNGSSGRQAEYPSSDPWVTSVGGTSLAVGKQNNYVYETGWGTASVGLSADGKSWGTLPGAYVYGGGGGNAQAFGQPFYQRHVVSRSLSTTLPDGSKASSPRRVVPDVSMVGDPNTGTSYGFTQQYPDGSYAYADSRIGGTSLSSPLFAGIQALAQQAARHPLGFANPVIYARYGTPAYRDVTDRPFGTPTAVVRANYTDPYSKTLPLVYLLRTEGSSYLDGLVATRGYDDVTGVGSPTRSYLNSFRH
jgi:subtilase family serine protease